MQHAAAMASVVEEILAGCADPDPAQYGMTSEEERAESGVQVGSSPSVEDACCDDGGCCDVRAAGNVVMCKEFAQIFAVGS